MANVTSYACVWNGVIIAGPGPAFNYRRWPVPTDQGSPPAGAHLALGDIMDWLGSTEAQRAAMGWQAVVEANEPVDATLVKNHSTAMSVVSGVPTRTHTWTAKTDAEIAVSLELTSGTLWAALDAQAQVLMSPVPNDLLDYARAQIAAAPEPGDQDPDPAITFSAAEKRLYRLLIQAASVYPRVDPTYGEILSKPVAYILGVTEAQAGAILDGIYKQLGKAAN